MNNENRCQISQLSDEDGFLRLGDFVGRGKAVPVSKSTWYALVKAGKAPAPTYLAPRIAVYSVKAIKSFLSSSAANSTEAR